jgi:hypothetical protein
MSSASGSRSSDWAMTWMRDRAWMSNPKPVCQHPNSRLNRELSVLFALPAQLESGRPEGCADPPGALRTAHRFPG